MDNNDLLKYDKVFLVPYAALRLLHIEVLGALPHRLHRKIIWHRLSRFFNIKKLKASNQQIPERLTNNFNTAMRCNCFGDLVEAKLELAMASRYPETKVVSECPAFRKGWNSDEKDCIDCKREFIEEYLECKRSSQLKSRKGTMNEEPTKPEPTKTEPTETTPKDTSPENVYPFKGFRKGSKADFMFTCLLEAKELSISDLITLVAEEYDTKEELAKFLVTSYVEEWANGAWGGKKRDFPFVVSIKDDTIKFVGE